MRVEEPKLKFFEQLMEDAKTHPEYERQMAKNKLNLDQYNGSKKIDPISDTGEVPDDAIVIRNITREIIESQKDMRIPAPKVTPRISLANTERNAKTVERLLTMLRDKLPFEKMNNVDEFYAPTLGATFYLVEFDNSVRTHYTVGEGKVSIIDPSDIIPQAGIYDVGEMEYIFIRSRMTREDIMRTYGVSVKVAEETEIDPEEDDSLLEQYNVVTVYTCFWRNENGAICKYVWSGDTELQDIDDYYARKKYVCKCCGKRKELCEENPCSHPEYEMQNEEYEELTEDIILPDYAYEDVTTPSGAVVKQRIQKKIPAFSPVYRDGEPVMEEVNEIARDDNGQPIMEKVSTGDTLPMMHKTLRPKTAPTRLPYYKPKRLPVICRRNIAIPKSLYGQSDCEVIRPQQQEINKLESRIHEKLMRSGAIEFHRKGIAYTVSGGIFDQSIEVPEGQIARDSIGSITCEMSIQQDMAQSERQYDMAKRNIGITDSYIGEKDTTAKSGVAKQQQILQASGRLESKRVEKFSAYADIDQALFELYLAYADEPRNVPSTNDDGEADVDVFSRYSFLEFDAIHGEWYYNDDYTFSVDMNGALEQQRDAMWQLNANDLASGAMGDPNDPNTMLLYWRLQEKAHRPNAQIMVSHYRKLVTDLQNKQKAEEQAGQVPAGSGNGLPQQAGQPQAGQPQQSQMQPQQTEQQTKQQAEQQTEQQTEQQSQETFRELLQRAKQEAQSKAQKESKQE